MALIKEISIMILYLMMTMICSGAGTGMKTDKAALLAFKAAIISDPYSVLANWNESTHVCNFTGVQCSSGHDFHRVVVLELEGQGLVGTLSPFISNLTQLRELYLIDNHFYGHIPSQLSSLGKLEKLRLDLNDLSGPILPDSFSYLWNLKWVSMWRNKLNGPIPPSLFTDCTLLEFLDLSENQLRGRIPPEIGNRPSLDDLDLSSNQLTGEIPFSLTNATQLTSLAVEDNQLFGELPVDIVSRLQNISYLGLSNNNMTSQDGNTNLQAFFTALSNCTQLFFLELEGMGLGGSFPRSIPTKLEGLLLEENQIHGEIPLSLTNATDLYYLNVEHNQLSGELPVAIVSQLPNIQSLRLSYNNMTSQDGNTNLEPIFTALSNCTQLRELRLAGMGFGGSLAHVITGIPETLWILDLKENQIHGSFPKYLPQIY